MIPLLNLLAYLATLVVNYAAQKGLLGNRPDKEQAKARTYVDPHPYAFSIWMLIYSLKALFVLAPFFSEESNILAHNFGLLFVASCVCNIAFLIFFSRDQITPTFPIMLGYTFILWWMYRLELIIPPTHTSWWHLYEKVPTATWFQNLAFHTSVTVHFGWVLVATVVCFAFWLKRVFGQEVGPIASVAMLAGLAFLGRIVMNSHGVSLVLMWGLWAIHYNNSVRGKDKVSPSSALVSLGAVVTVAFLAIVTFIRLFV